MDDAEWDQVAAAAARGDEAAFTRLAQELLLPLRVVIARRQPRADIADEILQEALVTIHRQLPRYEARGTFLPWAKAITRNLACEQARTHARYAALHRHADGDELDALVSGAVADLDGDEAALDERHDDLARLQRCLDRVPARAREMLERRHAAGVPLATLAQQFKLPMERLADQLKRLRRSLRTCVEGGGGATA